MPTPRVIYWFRTDLRLHDSPALKAALDLSPAGVAALLGPAADHLLNGSAEHDLLAGAYR